jgi:hypothetical protein
LFGKLNKEGKIFIFNYFGFEFKNSLVNPIFPLFENNETISSIYPVFHPASE